MTTLQELIRASSFKDLNAAETKKDAINAIYAAGDAELKIRTSLDVKIPLKPKHELVFTSKGVYRKKII